MDQWSAASARDSIEITRKHAARIMPIRFSISQIRAMSDEQIMSILSGEAKLEGTLYQDTLHLLSAELNRREIQQASKPHWTTTPAFILSAVAAVASVIAAVVSVVALLKVL